MRTLLAILLLLVMVGISHAAITDGLQASWNFESASAPDNHDGHDVDTISGATHNTSIKQVGTASFTYDGNDYMTVNHSINLQATATNDAYAISLWFYLSRLPSSIGSTIELVNKFQGVGAPTRKYQLTALTNDKLEIRFRKSGCGSDTVMSPTQTLSAGQWYHLIAQANGSANQAEVYLDGVQAINTTHTWCAGEGGTNITFGANKAGSNEMEGNLDQIMMWNRTLNQAEILQLNASYDPYEATDTPPTITGLNCTSCNPPTGDTTSPYSTTDTTPTFTFDTNVNANCRIGAADQNYTTLGSTRNCTSGDGTTTHTCSLTVQDELVQPSDYVYIGCQTTSGVENLTSTSGPLLIDLQDLNMTNAEAIQQGINTSAIWPGATVYDNQQVYLRDKDNNQVQATVMKIASYGDQRWLFNVVTDQEPTLGLFNITPAVYIYDVANTTTTDITTQVAELINTTKN